MAKYISSITRFLVVLAICCGCITGQVHLSDPYVLTALVALATTDSGSSQLESWRRTNKSE